MPGYKVRLGPTIIIPLTVCPGVIPLKSELATTFRDVWSVAGESGDAAKKSTAFGATGTGCDGDDWAVSRLTTGLTGSVCVKKSSAGAILTKEIRIVKKAHPDLVMYFMNALRLLYGDTKG